MRNITRGLFSISAVSHIFAGAPLGESVNTSPITILNTQALNLISLSRRHFRTPVRPPSNPSPSPTRHLLPPVTLSHPSPPRRRRPLLLYRLPLSVSLMSNPRHGRLHEQHNSCTLR